MVPFKEAEAIADVVSQVTSDPLDVKPVSEPSAVPDVKRHLKRAACDPEPSNPNTYGIDLSSASKFRADTKLASLAKGASTPSGYFNTFTNLQGASSAYGYMGYKVVESYDPSLCASECDSKSGCLSFNIYVERDPSANRCLLLGLIDDTHAPLADFAQEAVRTDALRAFAGGGNGSMREGGATSWIRTVFRHAASSLANW